MKKQIRDYIKLFIDIIVYNSPIINVNRLYGIDIFLLSIFRVSLEYERTEYWHTLKVSIAFWKLSNIFQVLLERK